MAPKTFLVFLLIIMTSNTLQAQQNTAGRYATVNGLKLYYELQGAGKPLVLLHGGGSTIESNFARVLPALAKTHQVIAIELQAHGHTADINRVLSFEQDADDVSALLQHLHIEKADILGFSNGGTTALQVAIRHPKQVNKLVLASALFKREGMPAGFFEFMQQTTIEQMPAPLKEAYRKVNADAQGLQKMFTRDVTRMVQFQDISDDLIKAIQAPALVINGDTDVIRTEHALLLSRTLPHAELAILPSGHSDYLGEICAVDKHSTLPDITVMLIDTFLAK
jgi:pimeloyl-ACP methyl ester carboxylesterase